MVAQIQLPNISVIPKELRHVVVLGFAAFIAAFWVAKRVFANYTFKKGSTPRTEQFDSMGPIEGLDGYKWEDEKPERIYKFADKYNLTMGLQKTDINWITRMDQQYRERIEERKKILDRYPGALGYEKCALDMVDELYLFLFTHYFPKRYPTIFRINTKTNTCQNLVLNEDYPLIVPEDRITALRHIALACDEDFLMLLPDADGDQYALKGMVWLYPVGFDPQDKLGLKMRGLHKPVPSYKQHLEVSMDRYIGRLKPGHVVKRVNWAVATNASLCERGEYHLYEDSVVTETEVDMNDAWVRCELQTLFALPKSGGRVLSVHLYLYPLQEIKDVGLAEEMCRAIDGYGAGNAPGFSRYKRIPVWGDQVKKFLQS